MPATQPPEYESSPLRTVISAAELATRLDKRLYASGITDSAVHQGCVAAVRQGVAAVITRPEHLELASDVLRGSGVGLATAIRWHGRDDELLVVDDVVKEAESLVGSGATEVAYIITPARLEPEEGRQVANHVAKVVETVVPRGAKVRTIMASEDLTEDEIQRTCQQVAAAGAWMVQGGSWRPGRTGLNHVETIRAALPPEVLVKWTEPIRALSTMLLCMSLGVDRFNCDVDQILSDARRAEWLAPLTIPAKGLDY
ncbi:hypothetical protein [Phycicoccus sp. Soil748]|uniref:hypothetical protein n=1 Tax=Phycicoccus sp. Soil748 TaxID=1736397 RepID=UPI000B013A81|nr:hypothetical protein [Phycicoccus sp. Soil748]